jgi:hypothetical protein
VRIVWVGLCCSALLFACGCGDSTVGVTTPTAGEADNPGVTTQTSAPASTAGSPSTLPAQSLLTHPTPRPPDVSAQFEFIGGAGPGPCLEMGSPPQVRVLIDPFPGETESMAESYNDKGIATYGQPVDVCFDAMGRGPISVTVIGPHGFSMSGVLPPLPATSSYHYKNEWASFDWIPAIEPSWPQGNYVITARAGSLSRSHTLTLVSPEGPGLRVLGPSTDPGHNNVPPHSHAKLFLTGFKGQSTVELVVYRTAGFGPHARFFSATSVPIPASGNMVVEIPTGSGAAREGHEPTFIITTRSRGRTLFAPLSVAEEQTTWPNLAVGSLPTS